MDREGDAFRRLMMSREERVEESLRRVEGMMRTLGQRVHEIEKRLDEIQGATARMDTHIHFITRVYSYFRAPLIGMAGLVNRFSPTSLGGSPDTITIEDLDPPITGGPVSL